VAILLHGAAALQRVGGGREVYMVALFERAGTCNLESNSIAASGADLGPSLSN